MGAGASKNAKQSIQQGGEVNPSTTSEVSPYKAQRNESHKIKNDYLKKTNMSESKSNTNKFTNNQLESDHDDDIDSTSVQMTDRELEDLESSLMEIPSLKGASPRKNVESKIRSKKDCYQDESVSIFSSPPNTQGHPPLHQPNSFYEFARKRPKRTGDVRRTSSLGRSNQFPSSNRRPYQRSVEDTQRLRFSWDDRKTNSATAVPSLEMDRDDEDEWTYRKTVIDGFDVAKFKKVNSKVDPPSSFIEKHSNNNNNGRKTFVDATQMPGVPTYDMMEQQLLASLEREIL